MKTAVISVSNIYCMPYYYKYEKILCSNNVKYDLIYWDRDLIDEKVAEGITPIAFHKKCAYNDENWLKIFAFFRFYRFVLKQIKKNKYDKGRLQNRLFLLVAESYMLKCRERMKKGKVRVVFP